MDTVCALATGYTRQTNDLLLLLHLDAETPCFEAAQLPEGLRESAGLLPKDKGGRRLVFTGMQEGAFISALACRLDGEDRGPTENLKIAVVKALQYARDEKLSRICIPLDNRSPGAEALILAVREGCLLGGYAFALYQEKKPEPLATVLVLAAAAPPETLAVLAAQDVVLECVNQARDLCNEPPNVLHPGSMAERLQAMAKAAGLETEVWNAERLFGERCGGILAVGQGAASQPMLVRASYTPSGACCRLALVGKGVTCDTGGYNLKPGDSLLGMKYDMAGAATAFAAACAIARLKLPLAVTVLAPLAENDISAQAFHVNDIITTRNGKTVEILNTDAEGRLLLADALALACEEAPDYLVDLATLTGAAVVGLGEDIAAIYGTDAVLTTQLLDAARDCGEQFWEMPLYRPYAENLKSPVADLNNTGKTRMGGSITAALFLQNWVREGQKWLHCDIAGPGGKEDPLGPLGKGGKGFGVRTLVALARNLCQA